MDTGMAFAEWDQAEYGVGIDRIDDQHRRLFELLDELHGAMKEGQGRDAVGDVLADLEEYTFYHFDDEEGFMAGCGYREDCADCFADHAAAHREFEERVQRLRERHEAGEIVTSIDTLQLLRDWLAEHIAGASMDQDYAAYLE